VCDELKRLVEDETGGQPTGGKRFVRSSLRHLAERLGKASRTTIARLLRSLGFSPRVNVKRFTGPPHPDRDRQFRYIRRQRRRFRKQGCPTISIDTKKKELIGDFKNAGRKWSRVADEVNAHDFRQDAECRVVPYGIYDTARNEGHVCVGTSAETGSFCVDALRHWWRTKGRQRYPKAKAIFIEADAGGGNSPRRRLWKRELQRWADATGLEIHLSHYPTGASKWNPVEHRLFAPISINWSGQPLRSLDTMLSCIRGTKTVTGLRVTAHLNPKHYPTKVSVSDAEMAAVNLRRHKTCPDWNYTITPQQ
jgi:hypothetical protein